MARDRSRPDDSRCGRRAAARAYGSPRDGRSRSRRPTVGLRPLFAPPRLSGVAVVSLGAAAKHSSRLLRQRMQTRPSMSIEASPRKRQRQRKSIGRYISSMRRSAHRGGVVDRGPCRLMEGTSRQRAPPHVASASTFAARPSACDSDRAPVTGDERGFSRLVLRPRPAAHRYPNEGESRADGGHRQAAAASQNVCRVTKARPRPLVTV